MKVLVVSGFLGAGKTTFITEMARRSQRKFVVMENEMGAVGVDGGLLSDALGDGIEVWELTQGCICCSMKSDFATSVLTIESALQPEYLLVEPTGVGMLSRIMDNLSKIAYERIELLSPITLLDSLNCRSQAREFPELFSDQLASAGTVVFSKAENLPPEERDALEALARQHAPHAEIVTQPYGQQSAEWWETLWRKAQDGSLLKEEAPEADLGLAVASLVGARISSPAALVMLLEDLLRGRFGHVVRAKGTVESSGGRLRFDVAGGQYCLSGADSDENQAQAVFIGKALDKTALYKALEAREAGHQGFTLEPFGG